MSENNINAYCTICGKGYHVCQSCLEQKAFKPWRTVTDTIAHYKIYAAIHAYTVTKDKKAAKADLDNCDLSELESFNPEIKSVIKEILSAESSSATAKKASAKKPSAVKDKLVENNGSNEDNE